MRDGNRQRPQIAKQDSNRSDYPNNKKLKAR
jgi:hypothetical protein